MRRVFLVTALAVTGLLGAGIAVAALSGGTTKVAPSFTLTAVTVDSATCDGDDGKYTTDAISAQGRIASGPLAGAATLELTWVKNTAENTGYAEGTLVVEADETEKVSADVIGAVTGATLRGSVSGTVGEEGERLIGTISIVRNGKSLAVKIGNGAVAGAAVVVGQSACRVQETATGEVIDIDLESLYVSIETKEGEVLTVSLTEAQATELEQQGIDFGDVVTIKYVETEDALAELVAIERD